MPFYAIEIFLRNIFRMLGVQISCTSFLTILVSAKITLIPTVVVGRSDQLLMIILY